MDTRARLAPWLDRHSQGIRHLVEPGPDDATLALLAQAALRAPDHAGLVPWRLAVVRGEAREALGELFAQVARERGKDEAAVAVGLAALEAGGDFADSVIAYEGRRLDGETFVSFDRAAVKLLRAEGEAAHLLP